MSDVEAYLTSEVCLGSVLNVLTLFFISLLCFNFYYKFVVKLGFSLDPKRMASRLKSS